MMSAGESRLDETPPVPDARGRLLLLGCCTEGFGSGFRASLGFGFRALVECWVTNLLGTACFTIGKTSD